MQKRLSFMKDLARQAGSLLREGYSRVHQLEWKGAIDLVTEYDLRSEKLLTENIQAAYPEEAILAEEGGSMGQGNSRWLIDPLDGTTNFVHGIPIFSISVGWTDNNGSQAGVVYDPMRDELFSAIRGGGSWLGDASISVSTSAALDDSLLVTGFPYDIRTHADNNLNHYADFALRSRGVRRLGSAAIDLAYVAAGRFDGYWELRLWPWDWAAGALLVREAGGNVTRAEGRGDVFREPTSILATNGLIHEEMLAVLDRPLE